MLKQACECQRHLQTVRRWQKAAARFVCGGFRCIQV